jgi:uncharacterized protein YndB with AHSA1/START domain
MGAYQITVSRLRRYPVKGFKGHDIERAHVEAGGGVPFDRQPALPVPPVPRSLHDGSRAASLHDHQPSTQKDINMSSKPPVIARVSRSFDAPAERVFGALLDPQKAGKFMFATAEGEMVRAEIDPRIGGKYVFIDRRKGEDAVHRGEYLEIDRPHRLVFTLWVEGYSRAADRVTIEIAPHGAGSRATLTHEMPPEAGEFKKRTEEGWSKILQGIEKVL